MRALATHEAVIERANKRMDDLKGERRKLDKEKEFYSKREMPENLKRSFAGNAESMQQQEKVIADANAEKARVNARFEAERQRFGDSLPPAPCRCSGRSSVRRPAVNAGRALP